MASDSKQGGVKFLADVRVLEVASLAPTQLGMHLADLGADVIKIEQPGGDPTRLIGKRTGFNDSSIHRRWNRGKRSIAIDLTTTAGKDVFARMVTEADVVIEGLRAGALEKMGFSWDALIALRPNLVFVSLSGYGHTGPYKDMGSHGVAFDALAGLAPAVVDSEGRTGFGPGLRTLGIMVAPMLAASATLAALSWSRRTGEPAFLDMAQTDAAAFVNAALEEEATDRSRAAAGFEKSEDYNPIEDLDTFWRENVTVQYYRTKDAKTLLLMALERKFFVRFVEAAGRPDLLVHFPADHYSDPLTGNSAARAALTELIASRDLADWMELCVAADVPAVPAYESSEALDDPQLRERIVLVEGDEATVTLKTPVHTRPELSAPSPAPATGQHSTEVLVALGYDADAIEALKRDGIVRFSTP